MDDRPLPLDVARYLVHRFGDSALDVARNRAATAANADDMRAHDHALMVLTEVEELLLECGITLPGVADNDGRLALQA